MVPPTMEFINQKQVNKLQGRCDQIKSDIEQILLERKDNLEKRKQLEKRLDVLQLKMENAVTEENVWKYKLDLVKKVPEEGAGDNFLTKICLLLGYQISKSHLKENGVRRKLLYGNNCSVIYNELNQLYELVEVYPPHPEFKTIQKFLQSSQDLQGLLMCLKKFFDTTQKGTTDR